MNRFKLKWKLLAYDCLVYVLTAVFLKLTFSAMHPSMPAAVLTQMTLLTLILMTVRVISGVYSQIDGTAASSDICGCWE